MDLHAWITQQVDRAQLVALDATPQNWRDETSLEHGFRVGTADGAEWVAFTGAPDDDPKQSAADARHIATNDPAAVLRRCEADRRILARHRLDPAAAGSVTYAAACEGCGIDEWGLPNIDNLNDCPELLDLAHAHGLTEETLAGLDRPKPPEPDDGLPADFGYTMRITQYPTPPITTSDVPAALRGPNWKH